MKTTESSCELGPQQPADQDAPKIPRYEAIAELLLETRASCEGAGDESLVCIVDAAYRICQACCYARDEVEWRRQAHTKAHQRQIQLIQELYVLIDLINSPEYEHLAQGIKDLLGPLPISETVSRKSAIPAENNAEGISETITQKANPAVENEAEEILTPFTKDADDSAKLIHPSLAIYFLSPFRVLLNEKPVAGWPNCKGKSIFKY